VLYINLPIALIYSDLIYGNLIGILGLTYDPSVDCPKSTAVIMEHCYQS
jgi:hypothetical protein